MCTSAASQPYRCRTTQVFNYISVKQNGSFCIGICTDGEAAMTGLLSGFTTLSKEVPSECVYIVLSLEKCWVPEKCHFLNIKMSLSGFTTLSKEVPSECVYIVLSLEKCWVPEKCHITGCD